MTGLTLWLSIVFLFSFLFFSFFFFCGGRGISLYCVGWVVNLLDQGVKSNIFRLIHYSGCKAIQIFKKGWPCKNLNSQYSQYIVNILRAVGQDPKEHKEKEISQMRYKILLLWIKAFAATSIKIWKNRPILIF